MKKNTCLRKILASLTIFIGFFSASFLTAPFAEAHILPLVTIKTELTIQDTLIGLVTTLPKNLNTPGQSITEEQLAYEAEFRRDFQVTQGSTPCPFTLVSFDPSLTAPESAFRGVFTCPATVDLTHIAIRSTLFNDRFHTLDHFASVYFNGGRYEILFNQTYSRYPEDLIARYIGTATPPAAVVAPPVQPKIEKKPTKDATGQTDIKPSPPVEPAPIVKPPEKTALPETLPEAASHTYASFLIVAWNFIWMGMMHVFTGYDHILFLFSIILLSRKVKKILAIITAFTLAHSLTLILSSFHIINIPAQIVEPGIALTIAYVAWRNIVALRRDSGVSETSERWLLSFCFGLVHGLGFASALAEAQVPHDFFIPSLLSFNIGIELGQLSILAVVLPLLFLADRWRHRKALLLSLAVGCLLLAIAWFLVRIFMSGTCSSIVPEIVARVLCI